MPDRSESSVEAGVTLEQQVARLFDAVESVSQVSDGSEKVFKVQLPRTNRDQRTVYVREVSSERIDAVQKALDVDVRIGIPESKLYKNDTSFLVMEVAKGRPLSTTLPFQLLPGVWRVSKTGLETAAEAVGQYLSRLHAETRRGRATPDNHPAFQRCLNYSDQFYRYLDGNLVSEVEAALSRIEGLELPVSCVFSDPTPHNVYYTNGDAELIDYTFYYNLSIKDVITFERGIELMVHRLPYGRRSQREAIRDAFRDGYLQADVSLEFEKEYDVFRLADYCYVLDRYLDFRLGGRSASLPERLTRYTDVRICVSMIESLVEVIDE